MLLPQSQLAKRILWFISYDCNIVNYQMVISVMTTSQCFPAKSPGRETTFPAGQRRDSERKPLIAMTLRLRTGGGFRRRRMFFRVFPRAAGKNG
jgi:hypothetical protein